MEQLVTFAGNHWELVAALVIILVMLAGSTFAGAVRGIKSVSPSEAIQLMNHENAVVIDVREPGEFGGGHVINSVHIPLGGLDKRIGELEKHKTTPIVVTCRSGHRSMGACGTLRKHGFESVYNLKGGIMAWQAASLPLRKD